MNQNIILRLHQIFAQEIALMNNKILFHINSEQQLVNEISDYLINSNSKRLRPLLTIFIASIYSYRGDDHIKLATAVEFMHAATLLHDDVVDNSMMRRSKPSANLLWGNKASILVGDFLFSQSFKLMVDVGSLPALQSLANASAIIAEGEVNHLSVINNKSLLTIDEYLNIIKAKTAELFAAACEVGAIIAGCSDNENKILHYYGEILGQIFQIRDDWLDYTAKSEELGKNIGDDYLEGKITLPIILLYQILPSEEKEWILNLFQQNEERSLKDFNLVLSLLKKYNVQSQVGEIIRNLKADAIQKVSDLNIKHDDFETLQDLLNFAALRNF